jgi:hypothetical protein
VTDEAMALWKRAFQTWNDSDAHPIGAHNADDVAAAAILCEELEKGRTHERHQIVTWLRANLRGNTDPWGKAADAIERGDYLKPPA